MPTVAMTPHLYRFFPQLENRDIKVPAGSVAEILKSIDEIAPGFSDYIVDERGALRRHVKISINQDLVIDTTRLTDRVRDDSTLYIFQALTGG